MVEVPTDPEICELQNQVCIMRRGNDLCPLHPILARIQAQMDWLETEAEHNYELRQALDESFVAVDDGD